MHTLPLHDAIPILLQWLAHLEGHPSGEIVLARIEDVCCCVQQLGPLVKAGQPPRLETLRGICKRLIHVQLRMRLKFLDQLFCGRFTERTVMIFCLFGGLTLTGVKLIWGP